MQRLKYIFLFLTLLVVFPSLGKRTESQDTISVRRAFMDLPSESLDLLSKNARFYMLTYFDNDSICKVTNNLGGESFLEKVAPDYISVRITDASNLQLKILKQKDGSEIVMAIYTVGEKGAATDSKITFFDSRLQEIASDKILGTPRLSDYFNTKGFKTSLKDIEEILPFYSFVFEANSENDNLKSRISYDDILTVEDAKIVDMMVVPEVNYIWDGKSYKKN